jgi:hypothetical protein
MDSALNANTLAQAVLRVAHTHPEQAAELMAVLELCVAKKSDHVAMPTQSSMNITL